MGADVQSAKSFGLLVRRYWAVAALTQEELASRAGLSVRAVSDMEHGRTRRPFLRSMRQLADALGLAPPERTAPPTGHRWSRAHQKALPRGRPYGRLVPRPPLQTSRGLQRRRWGNMTTLPRPPT